MPFCFLLFTSASWAAEALLLPGETVRIANIRPLVTQGKINGYAFGPAQQGIAYCFEGSSQAGLYFHTAAGEGPYCIWSAPPGAKLLGPVRWSADGLHIAFRQINRTGGYDLVVADYQGGQPRAVLSKVRVVDYHWSPDGKWLACSLAGKPWPGLTLVPSGGGQAQQLASAAADVRWDSLSRSVRWFEPAGGSLVARRYELFPDAPDDTPLPADQPPRPENSLWSPDGLLCASIMTYGQAPVIFEGAAAEGRKLPVQAARLFSWSPDSKILLGQEAKGRMFAVSANPSPAGATKGASPVLFFPPLPDPAAGPPSWSADGRKLALVARRGGAPPYPAGGLFLITLERSLHSQGTPPIPPLGVGPPRPLGAK